MPDRRLKVLYLAGNGRSGSTLLDVILGQVPGFFPVGEVRNLWDYGLTEHRPCGCGAPVDECSTWRDIVARANATDPIDPIAMAAWRERFAQTKRLLPIFVRGRRYADHPELRRYLDATERLYHAIAESTGAHVVVDSSKWPTYAFLLDCIPSLDVHVLHLVRDPRACAFSWRRIKEAEPGRNLDLQHPAYTTAYWAVWNPAIRRLFGRRSDRYHFLRYEDFARAPRSAVARILDFVGASDAPSPFVAEDTVAVDGTHAIEGNAAKFARGELTIRADEEWRHAMPWRNRALVTAMTWPLLWRYGYRGAWPPPS